MKVLFQDYSFNVALKQITFNTSTVLKLEQILIITNVTTNTIIYNFADPTKGGVLSNNILTLAFNTTAMLNTDSLQIFLYLEETPSTESTLATTNESIILLRRLVQLLTPISVQDSSQRQRVTIDAAPATLTGVTTVTTVAAVTNLGSLGSVDARYAQMDIARNSFANGIRQNLVY